MQPNRRGRGKAISLPSIKIKRAGGGMFPAVILKQFPESYNTIIYEYLKETKQIRFKLGTDYDRKIKTGLFYIRTAITNDIIDYLSPQLPGKRQTLEIQVGIEFNPDGWLYTTTLIR